MKQYTVVAPAGYAHQVGARVGMSKDQARRRRHQVKPLGGDVYEVLLPTMFKLGETFGMEGEVAKSLATEIVPAVPATMPAPALSAGGPIRPSVGESMPERFTPHGPSARADAGRATLADRTMPTKRDRDDPPSR